MKGYPKALGITLAFFIVFGVFINYGLIASYGNENINTIEVETYGTNRQGDPMFNEGLWAPGVQQSGIMRVKNNYTQRIRVDNLALKMTLERHDGTIVESSSELYEAYAKSMKLTITRGKLLVFSESLYDESFYEILYEEGNKNYQGYQLPSSSQFNIGRNDSVDLKYTITMDGNGASNNLQGLKATVDFMVNLHENPDSSSSGGGRNKGDEEETVEAVEAETFIPDDIIGHWAQDCILRLIEEGIIIGYPDGTIKPDNTITRAETAVLVGRALHLEERSKLFTGYLDPIPSWAKGYIIATTEEDIFEGYPVLIGRVFRPNRLITREEMAAVLMRGFEKAVEEDIILGFTDKEKISDWALSHVKAGVHNNIIVGYPDNSFKPHNDITRAEAFTMICKLLGYNEGSEE